MKKDIIITIGRQFGSGGLAVAQELGRRLGIAVYDSELLIKAAQESGFSAELFKRNDETRKFLSFSSIFDGSAVSGCEDYMSGKGLFLMQSETILNIARQGSAVIVGRCSNYILREMKNTLNVFLTAPAEIRAERIAGRCSVSKDKALSILERKDRKRAEYYNYYTFGEWGSASDYDLCIDSSILGIEGTAEFIMQFAAKAGLLQMEDEA